MRYSIQHNLPQKKWLKAHKKAILIFIDIVKAYDSVIRVKLYDMLSHIGIPSEYVQFYIKLTSNMRIYITEYDYIEYYTGLPQGSCISPVLFNIYYEEALRKITPLTEILLGYADDSVLGNTYLNLKKFEQIYDKLNNWALDLNLAVHPKKTNAIISYCDKPETLKYPVVKEFSYLGVKIYDKTAQFTKTFIENQIRQFANKVGKIRMKSSTLKLSKLSVTWWFLSKLFYDQISNLYLEFIAIPEFLITTQTQIKKILCVKKGIP